MTDRAPTDRAFPRRLELRDDEALSRWLLGLSEAPSPDTLRSAGLAAHAYTILPAEHPSRRSLQPDFLASLRRHHEIKREMVPLLEAWHQAGIDVLMFKGFYLAEFVYPVPGARFHGDVDVLMRPAQLEHALRIALSLGWDELPARTQPLTSHCAYKLVRKGGTTFLDVHRCALHVRLPWSRLQWRITDAVWDDSRARRWEGTEVREANPVDSLLVGLVLQRCWDSDAWRPNPFDIVDFRHLCTRCGVDREMLWSRARTLECERTLSLFLERCDPTERRFDLSRPARAERNRRNRIVFRERGLTGRREHQLARLLAMPKRLRRGVAFIPNVLRVRWALRNADVRKVLQATTRPAKRRRRPPPNEPKHVTLGVRWAMRLVGPGSYGVCLVRSLAIYSALRRRGWPVEFVSGVRRDGTRTVGHAWVEHGGAVLSDHVLEHNDHATYRENFRFPQEGTP